LWRKVGIEGSNAKRRRRKREGEGLDTESPSSKDPRKSWNGSQRIPEFNPQRRRARQHFEEESFSRRSLKPQGRRSLMHLKL